MLLFDTGKKLEKAFTSEQFAVLVEVLESREDKAASKNDLRETELRLQATIEANKKDLQETELRLQAEIEKLAVASKNDLRETELRLQKEAQQIKYDLLKWQFGIAFAIILVMAKGFGWLGF